jgi:hypothetical protein
MKGYFKGLQKEIALAAGTTNVKHEQLFRDIDREYEKHRSVGKEFCNEEAKKASERMPRLPSGLPRKRPMQPLQPFEES